MLPTALAAVLAAGCGDAGAEERAAAAPRADDPRCEVVVKHGPLPEGVGETSGVAASRTHRGIFWTHNDSGGDPIVFAVDAAGRMRARVQVAGARNRDWEDAAVGPCPGGDCLYLADTGNNAGNTREVTLWRVPEPALNARTTAAAERFTARWPQGSPDAEALIVLPDGAVYLVTKGNQDPVELYRWPTPLRPGVTATLERVREIRPAPEQPGDRVSGASASPDGRWVAVRTYSTLAFFRTAELLAGGAPAYQADLTPLGESQGEAVSLADDGSVTLTSEGGGKYLPGSFSRLRCHLR